jgi:3-hydroxyacyl-[acyl-carrier-protein] dehydratase
VIPLAYVRAPIGVSFALKVWRMDWLLVDRVDVLVRDEHIEAICVPLGDAFPGHFPAHPMVPGAFVLEALAQVGTILVEASIGFGRKAIPVMVDCARFRRPVDPATPMRVAMRCLRTAEETAQLEGVVSQAGARCCTAKFGFALAPLADFYGADTLPDYLRLHRTWLGATRFDGFARSPREVLDEAL